ncbi:hypothetical protein Tco_1074179 [Tanacetum coccineum]
MSKRRLPGVDSNDPIVNGQLALMQISPSSSLLRIIRLWRSTEADFKENQKPPKSLFIEIPLKQLYRFIFLQKFTIQTLTSLVGFVSISSKTNGALHLRSVLYS